MAANDEMDMAALMEADATAEPKPQPTVKKAVPPPLVSETHDAVYDIDVEVVAVLGRAELPISQVLKLGRGAVVELERKVEQDIELFVNDILIAIGEIVTMGDVLGVKINRIIKSNYTRV